MTDFSKWDKFDVDAAEKEIELKVTACVERGWSVPCVSERRFRRMWLDMLCGAMRKAQGTRYFRGYAGEVFESPHVSRVPRCGRRKEDSRECPQSARSG